jgi:UDP-N-acetylglucosamine 2-epimerase (non-hydrolysing)
MLLPPDQKSSCVKPLPHPTAIKKILHVVGARPNFVKLAPVMAQLARSPDRFQQVLVHTGQHYDFNMSRVFFDELELPQPAINLEVGSGSHAWQTAQIMLGLEQVLLDARPDWAFVYGDTNSTLAAALVCAKLGVPVAHVEAGLRSFDRTMPEEINRLLTDQVSDLLFTPSRDADANLVREGVSPSKIHFVGNVMIDTLVSNLEKTANRQVLNDLGLVQYSEDPPGDAPASTWSGKRVRQYIVATLHRPSNVDSLEVLGQIVAALSEVSKGVPVIFPVHPRTRSLLSKLPSSSAASITMVEPLGYLDFLCLLRHAALAVVDSGGVQEETTFLGVPCLTVRSNTERPVTITEGTNRLVPAGTEALVAAINAVLDRGPSRHTAREVIKPPELWDGRAASRIASVMCSSG